MRMVINNFINEIFYLNSFRKHILLVKYVVFNHHHLKSNIIHEYVLIYWIHHVYYQKINVIFFHSNILSDTEMANRITINRSITKKFAKTANPYFDFTTSNAMHNYCKVNVNNNIKWSKK